MNGPSSDLPPFLIQFAASRAFGPNLFGGVWAMIAIPFVSRSYFRCEFGTGVWEAIVVRSKKPKLAPVLAISTGGLRERLLKEYQGF